MKRTAILIGSGGLPLLEGFDDHEHGLSTPFGAVLSPPRTGSIAGQEVIALERHGRPHQVVPHEVNYRANLWLLKQLGVQQIVAIHTVGAIDAAYEASALVLPEQIVDYTWGRAHSFSQRGEVLHVDFSAPFDEQLRQALADAAVTIKLRIHEGGVYGCTQGPRLETAAEIDRMARDGCTVVGMTAMPEAALARELELAYASLSIVVNPAAGRGEDPSSIDLSSLSRVRERGIAEAARLLTAFFGQ